MPGMGELFKGVGLKWGGGGAMDWILALAIGFLTIGIIIGFIIWIIKRKSWNLKVGFKIPRYDGRIIGQEIGKGIFSVREGACLVKRKGMKASAMKPFDLKKYLQGANYLEVIQVGADDYRPILPESYVELIDDRTGEKASLLNVKIDTTSNKSWKNSYERERKNAFSIKNFLQEYGGLISIGLVIFLWGIQFLVLYNRIGRG